MSLIFLLSVILKGIGALLEVFLQITITKVAGLAAYGTYSAWINLADLFFWCFFSGIVKCNTFYLAGKECVIREFKKKYYGRYVIPVISLCLIMTFFVKENVIWIVPLIVMAELLVLDRSSTLLANGKYMYSLVGEYIVGRLFLLIIVLFLWKGNALSILTLVSAYLAQYILVMIFFMCLKRKRCNEDISDTISLKKWCQYQKADILQSVITQMPVILQYVCVGSLEAGVISIALLIKKLINFISGPASKIFLPEFSRLYQEGKKNEIVKSFASIMRLQMMFAGPLAVIMIGYPRVVLNILAEELLEYTVLFMLCSVIFIFAATLGPCGGLMQMSGNEKKDNRCRELAIAAMIITFILMRKNLLFALYGLCIQTLCEALSKYLLVCSWMQTAPVKLKQYLGWWMLPSLSIGMTYMFHWQNSFFMMIIMALANFGIRCLVEALHEKKTNNIKTYVM